MPLEPLKQDLSLRLSDFYTQGSCLATFVIISGRYKGCKEQLSTAYPTRRRHEDLGVGDFSYQSGTKLGALSGSTT